MTTTEIAKQIRADIKAAKKTGELPKSLKVSVRSEYFSMGSSINVNVKSAPFRCTDTVHVLWNAVAPSKCYPYGCDRDTPEAAALLETLSRMVNRYNVKDCDPMIDHFNVTFWDHVEIDYELQSAEREAIIAEHDVASITEDMLLDRIGARRAGAVVKSLAKVDAAIETADTLPCPPPANDAIACWLDACPETLPAC